MRLFSLVLLGVLAFLQYHLWWGKNGINDYLKIQQDTQTVKMSSEKSYQRNQEMYAEIRDLKAGLEAIEERARNELGMIKP
ncbi:MAG: cell division protein FtsB, partial [Vibrionaceae bacterium]